MDVVSDASVVVDVVVVTMSSPLGLSVGDCVDGSLDGDAVVGSLDGDAIVGDSVMGAVVVGDSVDGDLGGLERWRCRGGRLRVERRFRGPFGRWSSCWRCRGG